MRIERVDDKTVKCFLSNEELEQYQIDYKDFVLRSDKAREVVQEIIEQASAEVGYKPPKFAFDLQIMMMQDKGVVLTLSEKEPDAEQFAACLQEMKKMLEQVKENINSKDGSQISAQEAETGNKKALKQPEYAIFVFSKLRYVMNYASSLPANLRVESELYEMGGYYYVVLRKGHASSERYSRACVQAMEFSALYAAEEKDGYYLKEHGNCLIAEKALRKLRG